MTTSEDPDTYVIERAVKRDKKTRYRGGAVAEPTTPSGKRRIWRPLQEGDTELDEPRRDQ